MLLEKEKCLYSQCQEFLVRTKNKKFHSESCRTSHNDAARLFGAKKVSCKYCGRNTNSENGVCKSCNMYKQKAAGVQVNLRLTEEDEPFDSCYNCNDASEDKSCDTGFFCLSECVQKCKPWVQSNCWVKKEN